MKNMGSIIAAHNNKILSAKPTSEIPTRLCNCNRNNPCPLDGKCLSQSIVYKATVTAPSAPDKVYFGLTANTFKERYGGHKHTIETDRSYNPTALSGHVWKLKDRGLSPSIRYEIAHKATSYQCGSRKCDLCIFEKTAIALANTESLLNKRSEIVSTCRHRANFTYKGWMDKRRKKKQSTKA